MPNCQAYGCKNESGRTPVKRSYHYFPDPKKENSRAGAWLHNIGTGFTINTFNFDKKVVCGEHFHPNCFKVDMKAKLLGYTPKRTLLKPGAIPTIFVHKTYDVININGETILLFSLGRSNIYV